MQFSLAGKPAFPDSGAAMNAIRPVSPAGIAGLLLAALLAFGPASAPGAPADAAPPTFRVMTYNIHHGAGLDGKIDFQRIADLIKRERADVVALQEVDKGTQRTARRDCPAELAALTGMTCVFSNNYPFQGGEYGNAVLTRLPVKRWTNRHFQAPASGEPRGLLQLVLDVQGRELLFMDTHADARRGDAERLKNAAEILQTAQAGHGLPIILCGDFNDTPGSPMHQKLARAFTDTWTVAGAASGFTIPADKPSKRIDFIWLAKDSPLKPLKAWVPETRASDHLPVVVEFQWR